MGYSETIAPDEAVLLEVTLLAGLLALALLSVFMRNGRLEKLDQAILTWFFRNRSSGLNMVFIALTWLGSLWLLVPASVAVLAGLVSSGYRVEATAFGLGFLGPVITTYVLKLLLARTRPCVYTTLDQQPPGPAFPSAHTTQIWAFSLMLLIILPYPGFQWEILAGAVLMAIASTVAISRIYLQAHFPSDVAAGILVALIWAGGITLVAGSGVLV